MAIKAGEIIIDALEEIIVQAAEAPIEPTEARAALRALNDMMFSWAARGINIGYTEVDSMGSEVTVPLGAIEGIKANLAIRLAPRYNVVVPNELVLKAREGFRAIENLSNSSFAQIYPDTLPVGSGNYNIYSSPFFSEQSKSIATETGASIATEDDT